MSPTFRAAGRSMVIAASIFFGAACGNKNQRTVAVPPTPAPAPASTKSYRPPPRNQPPLPVGYVEEGVASWYGIPYHGRRAADGEIYDMETFVAAHRTMPFNTWLKVTNLSNRKIVTVRIIDRGPFVDGRIIDLSKAAARQLELIGPGVGPVRLEVISAPVDIPADDFYTVQVGVFTVYQYAERLRATLAATHPVVQLLTIPGPAPRWRVVVGKEPAVEGAQPIAASLAAEHHPGTIVRFDEKLPAPAPQPPPAVVEVNKTWQNPETVTFDPRENETKPTAAPAPPPQN